MSQSEAGYRLSEAVSNPGAQGLIKNQLIQKVYVKGREGRYDEVRAKVVAVFLPLVLSVFQTVKSKRKEGVQSGRVCIISQKPTCRCSRLVTIILTQKRKLPKHSQNVTLILGPGVKLRQFHAWLCLWVLEYTLSPFVL